MLSLLSSKIKQDLCLTNPKLLSNQVHSTTPCVVSLPMHARTNSSTTQRPIPWFHARNVQLFGYKIVP